MKFFLSLLLISNFVMSEETFTNTNQTSFESERSLKEFLKWRFTRKQPERIQIETSDDWKQLEQEPKYYAVWVGHSTYLVNNGCLLYTSDAADE